VSPKGARGVHRRGAATSASHDVIGDPVIVRADGHPAYKLPVVVDDALMEVTM